MIIVTKMLNMNRPSNAEHTVQDSCLTLAVMYAFNIYAT